MSAKMHSLPASVPQMPTELPEFTQLTWAAAANGIFPRSQARRPAGHLRLPVPQAWFPTGSRRRTSHRCRHRTTHARHHREERPPHDLDPADDLVETPLQAKLDLGDFRMADGLMPSRLHDSTCTIAFILWLAACFPSVRMGGEWRRALVATSTTSMVVIAPVC